MGDAFGDLAFCGFDGLVGCPIRVWRWTSGAFDDRVEQCVS